MAESASDVGKAALQEAVHATFSAAGNGGPYKFNIRADKATSIVATVAETVVTLGGIYACFKYKSRELELRYKQAVKDGLGGENENSDVEDIQPGSLHVLLRCFTDEGFLQVLEDFKTGKTKERLKKEFLNIGIETEGLVVEIKNIEEVEERAKAIRRKVEEIDNENQNDSSAIVFNSGKTETSKDFSDILDSRKTSDDLEKAEMSEPLTLGLMDTTIDAMEGEISSELRTLNRELGETGCSFQIYYTSLVYGDVGGALADAGVTGIVARLGGSAEFAIKAVELSLGRQITRRMTTAIFRCFITALNNNLDAVSTGGQKTTWKQFLVHVLFDALLGGITGLPGGLTEFLIQNVVSMESALEKLEVVSKSSGTCDVGVEDIIVTAVEAFVDFVEKHNEDFEDRSLAGDLKEGTRETALAVGKLLETGSNDDATDGFNKEANNETKKDTRHHNPIPVVKGLRIKDNGDGNNDISEEDMDSTNKIQEEFRETKNLKNTADKQEIDSDKDEETEGENSSKKSILVYNRSAHDVTLYIPKKFTKRHFLSESIIVDRGESYLFQSEKTFRFELTARVDGKNMKTIVPTKMWEKDIMLCVSGDHELQVEDKEVELKEKQICMRRQSMKKDVSASGTKNLYQVLGLTMKEVRMNSFEEQNRIIKEAYHSQLRRWHPDKNPENGDNAVCQEIIFAYGILKDPNTRAAYNNIADFDEGGLSKAKALFKPKSYCPDRARPFKRRWSKKRVGLSLLSVLSIVAGAGLTFLTAGMAAPVVFGVLTGSGCLMGAGISSGLRTTTRQSVEHGCFFRDYLISLVVGAVGGAAIGAGIAGIAGILGGAAKLAFKAAQLSLEKQISMRMVTTAFRGFVTSLTKNLDAILAGGPKTTWKQFILHVLLDALLGGIAGAPGGLTENMLENAVTAEEALSAIETFSSDARNSVEELTTIATETFADVLEERLNDDVENKAIVSHIKCGVKKAAKAVGKHSVIFVAKAAKKGLEKGKTTRENDESGNQNEENDENTVNTTPDVKGTQKTAESAKYDSKEDGDSNNQTKEANGEEKVKHLGLKYISEGSWFSKMLVDYEKDGEKKHCEGKGSGSLIWIPSNATNIKVSFQVMRGPGVWRDVKKYNFADDHWEKPIQTHIFEYKKPRSLTYTLAGKLHHEVVKNVSLDCYDNIDDNYLPRYNTLTEYHLGTMKQTISSHEENASDNCDPTKQTLSSHGEKTSDTDGPVKFALSSYEESTRDNNDQLTKPGRLKYVSKEKWLSKMLVDYEENGEEKHVQVKGSGSLIVLPDNATKIKVRFQVMRAPGVWSDVKEYDRFKKSWIKPTKPHIFKYDTPVSCTYTLAGILCYEAVMKVSGDDDIDERIEQKYFCNGGWSSKMLVDYEEDGEVKFHEARGSGSSIVLPTNATNINVRFQVMRAPGVWSDVKKYDRFKKCWIEPAQPHIFKYGKPASCTYTLTGSLNNAAVTKVSGDDIIDERIRLNYFSKESWSSKMLVDYEENGEKKHHEAHGSGSSILIPENATKIKVKFKVKRAPGVWSDVKEYDRFKKCWVEPTKPHIFEYDKPVSCTYTLAGNLYYEKVKRASTDDDNEDKQKNLKYISKGSWLSKMLVDYEENGEEKHHEAHGGGSSIWLPDNATNIKVKFQVKRGPSVWSDVKEYDRFKKCWIKPTKTHIFEYDTPMSCTYTLDGNLYYEAVMKVTGDDVIQERIGLKYHFEGSRSSKMLVDYELNDKTEHDEGEGSGSLIWIPPNATKIKISFQVLDSSGSWSDVNKYDRFKKCWIEPIQTHIFEYDTPVSCTYTLAEIEQCKVVVKLEQGDDDIDERVRLKYISDGRWFSKMLVDYEEHDEEKHREVKNSESSIMVPSNATNIKVRFQVMRGPGVWCDVKKYDRVKKSWIKPTKPHIFEYKKPACRTYTLAGRLHYEKVIKIMGEHYEEIADE